MKMFNNITAIFTFAEIMERSETQKPPWRVIKLIYSFRNQKKLVVRAYVEGNELVSYVDKKLNATASGKHILLSGELCYEQDYILIVKSIEVLGEGSEKEKINKGTLRFVDFSED